MELTAIMAFTLLFREVGTQRSYDILLFPSWFCAYRCAGGLPVVDGHTDFRRDKQSGRVESIIF